MKRLVLLIHMGTTKGDQHSERGSYYQNSSYFGQLIFDKNKCEEHEEDNITET